MEKMFGEIFGQIGAGNDFLASIGGHGGLLGLLDQIIHEAPAKVAGLASGIQHDAGFTHNPAENHAPSPTTAVAANIDRGHGGRTA